MAKSRLGLSTELSIQATQALVQLPFSVQRLKALEALPQLIIRLLAERL